MTEEQQKLLAVFEVRVDELLSLCDAQKAEQKALALKLEQEKMNRRQVQEELRALKVKYRNLLTAHVVSAGEGEGVKDAQKRLSDLVREIDDCIEYITLLNG